MPIPQPVARRPGGGSNSYPQALEMLPGRVHAGPEALWRLTTWKDKRNRMEAEKNIPK